MLSGNLCSISIIDRELALRSLSVHRRLVEWNGIDISEQSGHFRINQGWGTFSCSNAAPKVRLNLIWPHPTIN